MNKESFNKAINEYVPDDKKNLSKGEMHPMTEGMTKIWDVFAEIKETAFF